MTRRDLLAGALVIGGLLCRPTGADAHRLDEYLQATLIAVDGDRVRVEIALTPGANMARSFIRSMDMDGDDDVSAAEADAYVGRVLADVSLTVDGRRLGLTLEDHSIPAVEAMTLGTGTIRLRAVAGVPRPSGEHALVYRNDHRPDASVYLVNALAPQDRRVHLGPLRRDALQHSLAFDYELASKARNAEVGWVAAAAAMFTLIVVGRTSRQRRAGLSESS